MATAAAVTIPTETAAIGPPPGQTTPARQLAVGATLLAGALVIALCASHDNGSTEVLVALLAAVAALVWLARSVKRYGVFSLGGITCAMVATLFVGRWFLPPVATIYITPQAVSYYDRNGALIASSLMIVVFAFSYHVGALRRRARVETTWAAVRPNRICETAGYVAAAQVVSERARTKNRRRSSKGTGTTGTTRDRIAPVSATSASIADLATASILLVAIRLLTGLIFQIGVPGRQPAAVPLVGVIFYASSYGPLAGAALILWLGRDRRSSTLMAGAILLADILAESVLGSHGTAFLAVLVFGAAKATVGRPVRMTTARAVSIGLLLAMVITGALLISFVARESLNGGARQSLGDIPAFVETRFGGLEYAAPVIGAVKNTGSSIRYLRTSNWRRYMTADVYGLPPETQTGFAATAVGWWYGLKGLEGVAIGAAVSGFLASRFDRWCYVRRTDPSRLSVALAIGGLLGWATFFLGGTIGSLAGISIGFTGIAMVLAQAHRLVSQASSPDHHLPAF